MRNFGNKTTFHSGSLSGYEIAKIFRVPFPVSEHYWFIVLELNTVPSSLPFLLHMLLFLRTLRLLVSILHAMRCSIMFASQIIQLFMFAYAFSESWCRHLSSFPRRIRAQPRRCAAWWGKDGVPALPLFADLPIARACSLTLLSLDSCANAASVGEIPPSRRPQPCRAVDRPARIWRVLCKILIMYYQPFQTVELLF
jgi:hypothetical protein